MATIAYSSHEFIKQLKSAGVEEQQAEAIYTTVNHLQDAKLEDVATKKDLLNLEHSMELRFKEMDARMREMELRMVIKLGGLAILSVGLLFGLLRVWPLQVQNIPVAGQEYRLPPSGQR